MEALTSTKKIYARLNTGHFFSVGVHVHVFARQSTNFKRDLIRKVSVKASGVWRLTALPHTPLLARGRCLGHQTRVPGGNAVV